MNGRATHRLRSFRDGTRIVELNAVGLEVRSAAIVGGPSLSFESLPEKLRIDLGRGTKRDEEISIVIEYRAHPTLGVYFRKPDVSYPDRPKQVWTQGEAEEARHWIPCFDHPSDKLTTEVLVTAPKPLRVISNGRLVSIEPGSGENQVFHWTQEKPHSTYLIVVVVGEFAEWKGDAGGIPLGGYVPKSRAALAPRLFGETADMMAFFGERTGVRYPWPKYDQICVSGFSFGGMENTTATTLHENSLLDDRAALDRSSRGLIAHELAHQWFGDLVTCKDWGDIWLNESFATFFENLYVEHSLGWDEGVYERYRDGQEYKDEDRSAYRRRLSLRTWKAPEHLFDRHTYPKGARILSALRYVLGDDAFFAGIHRYLEKHAHQPVESNDFRIALEEASGQSLGWFFDEWVYSGGHPRYQVAASWDDATKALTVQVDQTQKVDDLTPLFRMPVVIAVTQPSGRTEHKVWVSEAKQTFTFPANERPRMVRFDPGDWILKDIEFPKSREELIYQLQADPDMLGRRDAAEALRAHVRIASVEEGLLERLEAEPFWAVRVEIVQSLTSAPEGGPSEPTIRRLEERFRHEPRAEVRGEIAKALRQAPAALAAAFLRSAIANDPSYGVVTSSLRSLAKVLKREAEPDAVAALERDSHDDMIREAAIDVLTDDDVLAPEARPAAAKRIAGMFRPGATASLRGAVLRALARIGKGNEDAFQLLVAALDDTDNFVRIQAAAALADLGDRRALDFLERRRAKERKAVLRSPLEAIQRAIARFEGKGDLRELEGELRRLREMNRALEERVGALEKKGASAKF